MNYPNTSTLLQSIVDLLDLGPIEGSIEFKLNAAPVADSNECPEECDECPEECDECLPHTQYTSPEGPDLTPLEDFLRGLDMSSSPPTTADFEVPYEETGHTMPDGVADLFNRISEGGPFTARELLEAGEFFAKLEAEMGS